MIRGLANERLAFYITPDNKIPVWDSSTKPWKKMYISEEEYDRLSRSQDSDTYNPIEIE